MGSTISDGCNNFVVPMSSNEKEKTPTIHAMLCHHGLVYIGDMGLWSLQGKDMVEGMSNWSLDFDFCEHYIHGKEKQIRFPFGDTRAQWILDLIHNDVFGPMLVPSLCKFICFVSFINDFSRNTWIYFLWKKYKVFGKFKEFKALIEN